MSLNRMKKKDTLIGSIGNIKKIDSDKTLLINNEKSLILKLLRKNKDEKNSIEDLIAA